MKWLGHLRGKIILYNLISEVSLVQFKNQKWNNNAKQSIKTISIDCVTFVTRPEVDSFSFTRFPTSRDFSDRLQGTASLQSLTECASVQAWAQWIDAFTFANRRTWAQWIVAFQPYWLPGMSPMNWGFQPCWSQDTSPKS